MRVSLRINHHVLGQILQIPFNKANACTVAPQPPPPQNKASERLEVFESNWRKETFPPAKSGPSGTRRFIQRLASTPT